jgi:hypothetical protein
MKLQNPVTSFDLYGVFGMAPELSSRQELKNIVKHINSGAVNSVEFLKL